MKQSTAVSMIDVLTPMWQRLLGRHSIGGTDDFFELGGNSVLAHKLFVEIGQVIRKDLSPLMIIEAPTISSLASLLERPDSFRLPPFVTLKPGAGQPPIFIAAGLGGNLLDFIQTARNIETDRPVLGLVAKGTDGLDEPLQHVEDMANSYLATVKKFQPHGPYFFIGGSFAGLVMLEMARCLSEAGEKIGLLCMLDTYPHSHYLTFRQRSGVMIQKTRHHLSTLMKLPIGQSLSYLVHRVGGRLPAPGDKRERTLQRQAGEVKLSPSMLRLRTSNDLAFERYPPRLYSGEIRYVKAENGWYFPRDVVEVWGKLVSDFKVEVVPGDHLDMITKHYDRLASVLSRFLREASS